MVESRRSVQEVIYARASEIGTLFNTHPIDGSDPRIWFRREDLERNLQHFLGLETQHICIDGPSGTGKTSLVKKIFRESNRGLIHVQMTADMEWPDFTRQFVEIPISTKTASSVKAKGVLSFFRPSIEGEVKYDSEYSEKESYELLIAKAKNWKSHDVAKWVAENDVVLIVDDFELASEAIVVGIASVAKILGQSYSGKLVLIGTDDIFSKVTKVNSSLGGRIKELTVGGLPDLIASSNFVLEKFSKLGVTTPLTSKTLEKNDLLECRQYIYDAANGLLKELNSLGMELAVELKGSRKNLSLFDIKSVCTKIIREKRLQNRAEIRRVSTVLANNIDFRDVFDFLIRRSASSVTFYAEMAEKLSPRYSEANILSALEYFQQENLIVVTGGDSARIFFKNPPLLNLIKAHIRNGKMYGWIPADDLSVVSGIGQISLGLTGGGPRK